ncbi:unnamed protein product [Moneuplotes crassus]|uniref:Mitogen-activated protein kinase n=1 Tax=Euplotes crassus TaxID=5936 RepID=A0AAD1U544_EUPCR|nr:unnamed protein product [Moneuplotes crassus]
MNVRGFTDALVNWDVGDEYECISLLGTGSYGSVCKGRHKRSGKEVAIKQIKGIFDNQTDCKRILREIKILRKLNHPYIIRLYDIVEPRDLDNFSDLYLILQLADSDLKKVLRSGLFLTPKHVKEILYNLMCALYYLHSAKVLHRDLKPANVLVDENCSVLLCDFGLARSIAVKEVQEESKEEEKNQMNSEGEKQEDLCDVTPNTTETVAASNDTVKFERPESNGNGNKTNEEETQLEITLDDQSGEKKNFEPSCHTPKLSFKKPSSQKRKAKPLQPKRKIQTGIFSIGAGGGFTSSLAKPSSDPTSGGSIPVPSSKMKKRDLKTVEKADADKEDKKSPELAKKEVKKDTKKDIQSNLSVHVVTRWYRSPEIILLERDYGPPIDIWSVGCIFAELLTMLRENAKSTFDRKPLFPGSSCYPLSPSAKNKEQGGLKEDQLCVIIEKLGTPSKEDTEFITDPAARQYLEDLPLSKKKNFKEMYPFPGDEAIDLLNKMLQFNPYKRASLEECLNHPHLDEVRRESKILAAPKPIVLDFDFEDVNTSILRGLFAEEILYYRSAFKRRPRRPDDHVSKVETELYSKLQSYA